MAIRQVKYVPNSVEQDHRAVKRLPRPMLGLKAFDTAYRLTPNRRHVKIRDGIHVYPLGAHDHVLPLAERWVIYYLYDSRKRSMS